MMKAEDFNVDSLAFISKVKLVKHYDQKRWFKGAYSTLNARFTIKGDLPDEAKEALANLLFSSIEDLKTFAPLAFDKWFYKTAKGITDKEPTLSFGHTQKLINILLKYHFVYFYSGLDESWNKANLWLVEYFNQFHAPIDRKVLQNLSGKYSLEIPFEKFSWTKWQWNDKALYEEVQEFIQRRVNEQDYYSNRLYFEMKALWKASQESTIQLKRTGSRKVVGLESFLDDILLEVNKQDKNNFELSETTGYFSIAVSGAKRNKNVVCFVKNEPVISINKCVKMHNSVFDTHPFSGLRKMFLPPRGLQLRPADIGRYPYNLKYDFKKDKPTITQLCKLACENLG